MVVDWEAVLAVSVYLACIFALFLGVPALQGWWSGMPRRMRRALRGHGVSPRSLGRACVLELTRYTSGLADITQQEYASTPEWAFDRMADPIASEVARFKKGQVPEENQVGKILRRHGVTPDA